MKARAQGPVAECAALFREGHADVLIYRCWNLRGPDLADLLLALSPAERQGVARLLPARLLGRGLAAIPAAEAAAVAGALPVPLLAAAIDALEGEDAARLLDRLPPKVRDAVLGAIQPRAEIDRVLQHRPGSAGRAMQGTLLVVTESDPVALALEAVRRQARDVGDAAEIHVVDVGRRLTGLLSFRELVLAPAAAQVRDVMRPATELVGPEAPLAEVAERMRRYRLEAVPVVDAQGRLLGSVAPGPEPLRPAPAPRWSAWAALVGWLVVLGGTIALYLRARA